MNREACLEDGFWFRSPTSVCWEGFCTRGLLNSSSSPRLSLERPRKEGKGKALHRAVPSRRELKEHEGGPKDGPAGQVGERGLRRRAARGAGVSETRFLGRRKCPLPPHHLRLLLLRRFHSCRSRHFSRCSSPASLLRRPRPHTGVPAPFEARDFWEL